MTGPPLHSKNSCFYRSPLLIPLCIKSGFYTTVDVKIMDLTRQICNASSINRVPLRAESTFRTGPLGSNMDLIWITLARHPLNLIALHDVALAGCLSTGRNLYFNHPSFSSRGHHHHLLLLLPLSSFNGNDGAARRDAHLLTVDKCVCVCVCVYVRACVRAHVCVHT